jgi:hypothetical protein
MNTQKKLKPRLSGLAAELIVAAQLVDHGWNIYSPHVDEGFDFIAVKPLPEGNILMRPVQVRGRYPEVVRNRSVYGKRNSRLSQLHDEMVFALPYFKEKDGIYQLVTVAFLPKEQINVVKKRTRNAEKDEFYCTALPAKVREGTISARRDYEIFFDGPGIEAMYRADWKDTVPENLN